MTNELIKIEERDGKQLVSGRDLHEFLEIKTPYKKWFDRMCEYGFIENIDFVTVGQKCPIANGGFQEQTNHFITLNMAKEISMIQRNEKGKQARQYFIKCEEAWNSPEMILMRANQISSRMLETYSNKIKALEKDILAKDQQIIEMKPKASYYDLVLQSDDLLTTTMISKDYGLSAITLNKILHEIGIQFKQSGVWFLYQKYAKYGYTKTQTNTYSKSNGEQGSSIHMYWTQKGRLFLYENLKANGYLPLIEKHVD